NIVQVFDFSRFGQSLYIVMELVDGCDLSKALQHAREQGTVMPLEAAMHVAVELLKGLEYAHRRGVVHRDLSPSNILCSRNGEVKIADFGIAQVGGADITRTVKIMGKWRYMSPEQTRGEDLDARSDVFSTGAVIYELFTGQRLFPGNSAEEIVYNIEDMDLPRLSEVRTDLPAEIDAPILAALERDRGRRRMTAAGLLEALLEVCYTMSIPALPTSLARYIEQATAGDTGQLHASSPGLLDEIIVSEIGRRGPPAAGAAKAGGRQTAMALAPPAMHPDDMPPEEVSGSARPPEAREPTHVTVIRSIADPEGSVRRWVVGDVVATVSERPQRPPSGQGDAGPPQLPRAVTPLPYDGSLTPLSYEIPATAPPRPAPPRHGRTLALAALAAALTAIVVTLAVKRARRTEAAGEVEVVADPAAADEPVAPAPAPPPPPSPTPRPAAAADAAPAPQVAASADAGTTREPPVERDPSPARARHGTVDIFSEPWAEIYLGQKKLGTAPQRGIKLPYGKHRLKLVNPVQNRSTTVTVTIPASRPVRVTLPAARDE
ncbi:MAG TPA: serine/threonine-protein kinase, partial [Kofleriaceae bacterium]|nr:serine/threonine-protein kinase [Kofleriaceae bacterium]